MSVLIIDEISMVSSLLFLNVHLKLCEIFGVPETSPFAGKTVIDCGDFLRLPPVLGPRFILKVTICHKFWNYGKILNLQSSQKF